jgi:hypothetical protein
LARNYVRVERHIYPRCFTVANTIELPLSVSVQYTTDLLFEDTKGVSNQNPYIEEGQTIQWPKEKVQMDKQRSTKHTPSNTNPTKNWGELRCYFN